MPSPVRYPGLAALVVEARTDAKLKQGDLARLLGLSQQSISRWEAGTHRPAIDQISALAKILNIDEARLIQLAQIEPTVTPILPLLPLGALSPEHFERFVGDLAAYSQPDAHVIVRGGRGHDQGGWDVMVDVGGEETGIQCKRAERFGPADVKRAIVAADKAVSRKVLALSRIASPATADLLRESGWQLWDQDVLSRKVRQLPGENQDRLIDDYFRGQRRTLLGRDDPGPWIKPDRFFAPFDKDGAALSHNWDLVGREQALSELAAALGGDQPVVLLSAPGGMGKSRLVKACVTQFSQANSRCLVRFVSPVAEVTPRDLEALGPGEKLIVVDDAHDRDGLSLLIGFAADPDNRARLLLATRPYAQQRIRNELARFALHDPVAVNLTVLGKPAMEELVKAALARFGGNDVLVDVLVSIAGDNPLVAVMAARVASEQATSAEMVRMSGDIRKVVVEKFTQVLTGAIGEADDRKLIRDMLGLVALLQPVRIDDREIGALLESVTSHSATDASRALKLLIEGGILYRRGKYYRLMPDLLGDYLIDDLCIQADERLSLFAERVIKAVDDRLLTQVMVNLGRLDWRRNDGDPSGSRLLDVAWDRFRDIDHDWDPRIEAVRSVAVYQPEQALDFVRDRLRSGKPFSEGAKILGNIVYTDRYRDDALWLLWEIGRRDPRDPRSHPGHAIRVLSELCAYGEHKSLAFCSAIADFAFGLMDDDGAWSFRHTPFAIVAPLLKGTIDLSRAKGRMIELASAFVPYAYARPLRAAVIERIFVNLEHPRADIAAIAARFLHKAIRAPYGIGGSSPEDDERALYDSEFAETLGRVAELVESGRLAATTVLEIADAVSWHAEYGAGPLRDTAVRILEGQPSDLPFCLRAAMVERARTTFWRMGADVDWQGELNNWLTGLTRDLSEALPEPEDLLDAVESALRDLAIAGISSSAAVMLMDKLAGDSVPFARLMLARAALDPHSPLRDFAWSAIAPVLEHEPAAAHRYLGGYLDHDPELAARTFPAIGSLRRAPTEGDFAMLERGLASDHLTVAKAVFAGIHGMKSLPDKRLKALVLETPFERHPQLLDEVAMLMVDRSRPVLALFDAQDARQLLSRMRAIKSFEGHWHDAFLTEMAKAFAEPFADYLFDRTDRALAGDDEIDPIGYRYHEGKLGFDQSPDAVVVFERAWTWLRRYDAADGYTIYRAAGLVAGMFDIDAPVVVEFLDARMDDAGPLELEWIGRLLRHTHHAFAFRHQGFVECYLDRCVTAGAEVYDHGIEYLSIAATSGMKGGTVGEPMPRDIEARDRARSVLRSLPRLSPAYVLYETILRDAERDIEKSIREGRALDDEEFE